MHEMIYWQTGCRDTIISLPPHMLLLQSCKSNILVLYWRQVVHRYIGPSCQLVPFVVSPYNFEPVTWINLTLEGKIHIYKCTFHQRGAKICFSENDGQ